MISFDLTGKVAVVTGASSGLGQQFARALSEQGCDVAILARRKERLEEFSKELKQNGHDCLPVSCDVTDETSIKDAVKAVVDYFGKIDILVNNAGVVDSGLEPIEKVTDETIDSLIDINAKGTLYMAREAAKVMVEAKAGSIVNVASVAGYTGGGGVAYVASKAAVIGMTKNIAMRCAADNVRCNALCPGSVVTPMTTTMNPANLDPNMMGAMAKHADLTLPVSKPEEIANTILFLASDEASAITGQVIVIDHGANL